MQSITLAEGFEKENWKVKLVTLRPLGPLFPLAESRNISVHSLQAVDLKINSLHPGLSEFISTFDPHALLLMGRTANCLGSKIRKKFPGISILGTFRTGRSIPRSYRESLAHCNHIFCNSQWAAGQVLGLGIPKANFSVIPNGLAHPIASARKKILRKKIRETTGTPKRTTVFLKVAAFIPGKNHKELLHILSKLEGDWELWLVGSGRTLKSCRKLAAKLQIDQKIRFFGHLMNPEAHYFGADVAVLTSREESLPNFLVEAQATGLPVVAYDCAGVRETFRPNNSGILVPQESQTDFHSALQSLLNNPTVRKQMGKVGQIWAQEQFCPQEKLRDYMDKIREISSEPN